MFLFLYIERECQCTWKPHNRDIRRERGASTILLRREFDDEKTSMPQRQTKLCAMDCPTTVASQLPNSKNQRMTGVSETCIYKNTIVEMHCFPQNSIHTTHSHAMCNKHVIFLFGLLNQVVKAFSTCYHGQRTNKLTHCRNCNAQYHHVLCI